ncbi:unnamed protein product [Cuscuta europaea]|jgi:hypothetical protein
MRS